MQQTSQCTLLLNMEFSCFKKETGYAYNTFRTYRFLSNLPTTQNILPLTSKEQTVFASQCLIKETLNLRFS